jgi:hypothetical protein
VKPPRAGRAHAPRVRGANVSRAAGAVQRAAAEPCSVPQPRAAGPCSVPQPCAVLLPRGAFLLLIVGLAAALGPARRGLRSQPIR